MTINMGPQHPATHGVLRLVLELDGEVIVKATPHIGHLHRGVEKLAESKTYHQVIPLTDRLDYTNAMGNNLAYVLAVEKLLGIELPQRSRVLRVILCEMARISAHLLWLGTHALDIGAATVFFYTFQQREILYDLYERLTGARFTTSGVRIGTPAITTRGFSEIEAEQVAHLIADVLDAPGDEAVAAKVRGKVDALCRKFPVYGA